jgi:hypothetical protein
MEQLDSVLDECNEILLESCLQNRKTCFYLNGLKINDIDDESILLFIEKNGKYIKKIYILNNCSIINDASLCFIVDCCNNLEEFYYDINFKSYIGSGLTDKGLLSFCNSKLKKIIIYCIKKNDSRIEITPYAIDTLLKFCSSIKKIEIIINYIDNGQIRDTYYSVNKVTKISL